MSTINENENKKTEIKKENKFAGLADSFVKGSKARKITDEVVNSIGAELKKNQAETKDYKFTTKTIVNMLIERKIDYTTCKNQKTAIVTSARSVLRKMGLLNTVR